MMHQDHEIFESAVYGRKKLVLTFFCKEDNCELVRTCAPFDYAPRRRAKDQTSCYHFWDYDSDKKMHTLSLLATQIVRIEATDEVFDPADIITWDTSASPWNLPRDWGRFS